MSDLSTKEALRAKIEQEFGDEQVRREAEALHDQWPGRWPSWASPARMRRDLLRDREEDQR